MSRAAHARSGSWKSTQFATGPPPSLATFFAQVDRNGDGVLSVDEAKRALLLLGLRDIKFDDLDADGNGVITLEEVSQSLARQPRTNRHLALMHLLSYTSTDLAPALPRPAAKMRAVRGAAARIRKGDCAGAP